jgi:2-polyprenyl-6-methoxyphenol hydroxylase-like FAD-dependent oxidoreductase
MTTILVVGAGIAGPALAHWLHRVGIATTVVEHAAAPRPGGQAVDLRGVARDVIARMGLADTVREAALRTTAFTTVDAAGRALRTVGADAHGGDGELAEIEILRGDLAAILTTGIDVHHGTRLVALDQDADGVLAGFADGTQQRFDVVVGADGLHSRVRALAFGDEADAVRPLGTTIALWTVTGEAWPTDHAFDHSDGDRFAGVRPVPGDRRAIVYLAFPTRPEDAQLRPAQLVRERASGMGWAVPRFVAQVDDAPDLYVEACSQVVLPSWSRGRIGLVGDAACCPSPLSGQGTGLALVGAYVLAGELVAAGADPVAGLRSYEERLRPWAERVQQIPHEGADGAAQAAVASGFELPRYPLLGSATGYRRSPSVPATAAAARRDGTSSFSSTAAT